jgi:hypothetical protein
MAVVLLSLSAASCGRLANGCGREVDPEEPSVRERFRELRGTSGPATGRWGALRANDADESVETQIRQLEALGYASGTKTAPDLVGVTVHVTKEAQSGLNFYTAGHAPEAILMDMNGRVLHRWSRSFWQIWPEDETAKASDEGTQHWRRAHLFPNGDVLVICEGLGLAKLDARSNVIWARRNGSHHDLEVLPNGDIAVLAREAKIIERIDSRRPTLEDFVVILDPRGREKARYSVLEAFERSEQYRSILEESSRQWGDLFHTNSIEALDGQFVARNPAFEDGSFLLSSRHLDTVFVLDPENNEVEWALQADFDAQHDARLLDDGSVMLFDNSGRGRYSSVRVYDPTTKALTWEYTGSPNRPFYTRFCGASQRLANGNTLITESDNGRAFEVTANGTLVWEFYNPHRAGENDEYIATLFQVERYPSGYARWLASD